MTKPSSDLRALYRNFPVYLWVEDEETRTYLETVWVGESLIKIYVADGHPNIAAIVNAAHRDRLPHVFGLRDRDFGGSNRARWSDPAVRVLCGDSLELENLLLDADAIAACAVNTAGMSTAQIEAELNAIATPLVWWMSCRRTLTELRDALTSEFPAHPTRYSVPTQQAAEQIILASTWWHQQFPAFHQKWTAATIQKRLAQHEAQLRPMLASNAWKQEWSGKEVLSDLVARVWTRKRLGNPAGRIEFIRAIAEAQCKLNRVPPEIAELRTTLRQRIGR